jgi:hypothetical protein
MRMLCVIATLFVAVVALSGPAKADELLSASGKLTMLRVHDVGTAYGPPADQIDVEVVFLLDSQPGRAFGFQLRNDGNQAARQGMLSLLTAAFANNWTVTTDYFRKAGNDIVRDHMNGVAFRVWVTK